MIDITKQRPKTVGANLQLVNAPAFPNRLNVMALRVLGVFGVAV
jgi:hypothetical protein